MFADNAYDHMRKALTNTRPSLGKIAEPDIAILKKDTTRVERGVEKKNRKATGAALEKASVDAKNAAPHAKAVPKLEELAYAVAPILKFEAKRVESGKASFGQVDLLTDAIADQVEKYTPK